jgi:hypothetical protein
MHRELHGWLSSSLPSCCVTTGRTGQENFIQKLSLKGCHAPGQQGGWLLSWCSAHGDAA